MALAGALACQKDSYLQVLDTQVKTCEAAQLEKTVNGKKTKISCYEVTLEDTVLFPEGGGQPDDRGTINETEVLRIIRKGGDVIHYTPVPLDPGVKVTLKVDWQRRFDHMQQHSGQHLITAVADDKFGFPTLSWNLSEKISTIEMGTPSITQEQIQQIEDEVNENIRKHVPMYATTYDDKDSPQLHQVRTRGLPDDHTGPVRIVTMEGIEANMCCGTHVSNLSHLQAIKILGTDKGKKGKSINLVFVAGDRVLQYLQTCYNNEKALTQLLKGPPQDHAQLVSKVQTSFRVAQKGVTNLLRDVAILEAYKYNTQEHKERLYVLHRTEGDTEFMNQVVNEITDKDCVKFLSVGDDRGSGMFLLCAKHEFLDQITPKVLELLEGKGAAKNGKLQGKANKLQKRPHVIKYIRETLALPGS